MPAKVNRMTVDLASYPDLVVIYLGMRANSLKGLLTLFRLGPQIKASVDAKPDGLLLHENIFYGFFPPHLGMRQYWRDFQSVETWARSMPHRAWWQNFLRDSGGTGFWNETYFMRGGIEAVYDNLPATIGLSHFAPPVSARGPMYSSRKRAGVGGEASVEPPLSEEDV
jgi:hypothetical protein